MAVGKLRALIRDPENPAPYVIGETAHNHAGDLAYARRTVRELGQLPVHAIKLHLNLVLSSYASKDFAEVEVYERFIWPDSAYGELIDLVHAAGKECVCLVNDVESLDYVLRRGDVPVIELHAVSLYDVPMLDRLADFDGVVMLGVGGSQPDEIDGALARLERSRPHDVLLMYGFQQFPTDPSTVNLANLAELRRRFGREVGYADHTSWDDPDNVDISTAAYLLGSRVLEKHYTPEPGVERIDYQSSVGAQTFRDIERRLQLYRTVCGAGSLTMSDAEKAYGQYGVMKKAVVAARNIRRGERIDASDLRFKRTSIAAAGRQSDYDRIAGSRAARDIERDDMILLVDVDVGADLAGPESAAGHAKAGTGA